MLPLLSDADLHGAIVSGLLLHFPEIDLVRAQDVGLMSAADPDVLEFAANQRRAIVSHDRNTMTGYARDRWTHGLTMPGLIVVDQQINIGKAIQELGTLAEAGEVGDLDGQIIYLS